jgi:hypothetical protein
VEHPILPWLRVDSSKPVTTQLSKARVLKGKTLRTGGPRGTLKLPTLHLVKPVVERRGKRP